MKEFPTFLLININNLILFVHSKTNMAPSADRYQVKKITDNYLRLDDSIEIILKIIDKPQAKFLSQSSPKGNGNLASGLSLQSHGPTNTPHQPHHPTNPPPPITFRGLGRFSNSRWTARGRIPCTLNRMSSLITLSNITKLRSVKLWPIKLKCLPVDWLRFLILM